MTSLARRAAPLASLPVALALACLSGTAAAHTDGGAAGGFVSGVLHPLLGLDHLVAMVAVGLWGAFLGRPAIWLLPVVFPTVMALGGALGIAGMPLPAVEVGIAVSGLLLGLAVALAWRAPLAVAAVLVGAFAIFHGHAHGTELPEAANPVAYSAGFVLCTGALHLAGIGFGELTRFRRGAWFVRGAGAVVALVGATFLAAAVQVRGRRPRGPAAAIDSLFLEGVLLPLRTGAALVAALAAGTLVGASGAIGARSAGLRPPAASLGLAFAGIALGLALPRLAGADAVIVASLVAAALACVLVGVARVPSGPATGALAGVVAGLGAQAAFARFLAGELPVSVTLGAAVGLALAVTLPATLVRAARAFAPGATPGATGHRAADVGTRVLSSWIGAVTLLLLALTLRSG